MFFDIHKREYLVYASRKSEKENPLGITISNNNVKNKLSTWLCSRTIYYHYWEEGNWYKDDLEKLNKKFPNEVQLSSFQINMNLLLIIGLGFFGTLALTMRKIGQKKGRFLHLYFL